MVPEMDDISSDDEDPSSDYNESSSWLARIKQPQDQWQKDKKK